MSAIDYVAILNDGLAGFAVGVGFSIPCYLAARMFALNLLTSPIVQTIGKAAAMFVKEKGGGDWKGAIVKGGFRLLERFLG